MIKIRLLRKGKKHQPHYSVVVADKRMSPRGGNFIEKLGFLNPKTKEVSLNKERIKYWLGQGAKCSDTVHNLLVSEKLIEGKKIDVHKESKKKTDQKLDKEAKTEVKPEEKKEESKLEEKEEQKSTEEGKEEDKKEEKPEDKKEEKENEDTPEKPEEPVNEAAKEDKEESAEEKKEEQQNS